MKKLMLAKEYIKLLIADAILFAMYFVSGAAVTAINGAASAMLSFGNGSGSVAHFILSPIRGIARVIAMIASIINFLHTAFLIAAIALAIIIVILLVLKVTKAKKRNHAAQSIATAIDEHESTPPVTEQADTEAVAAPNTASHSALVKALKTFGD